MTYSPLISETLPPKRQSYGDKWSARPDGVHINGLIVHHHATTGEGGIARLVNSADKASANYIIRTNGALIGSVPEEYRAWTSGSYAADDDKITVEVQNSTGAPEWAVSDEAFATLVALYADLSARYAFPKDRAHISGHRDWAATSCPGPYLYPRLDQVAGGGLTPVSVPAPARSSVRQSGQDVRKGDTGPGVSEAQHILKSFGFYGGQIDSSAGPQTDAAIRAFQVAAGITVDGSFGPDSRAHAAKVPSYPGSTVHGDRGTGRTRRFQERLKALGYYTGKIDDSHGPLTTDALKRFQSAVRITVDGSGGPQTWTALWAR